VNSITRKVTATRTTRSTAKPPPPPPHPPPPRVATRLPATRATRRTRCPMMPRALNERSEQSGLLRNAARATPTTPPPPPRPQALPPRHLLPAQSQVDPPTKAHLVCPTMERDEETFHRCCRKECGNNLRHRASHCCIRPTLASSCTCNRRTINSNNSSSSRPDCGCRSVHRRCLRRQGFPVCRRSCRRTRADRDSRCRNEEAHWGSTEYPSQRKARLMKAALEARLRSDRASTRHPI